MAENNASYYDFIKSGLYTSGSAGGKINKGYQDPTFLSFVLMFVPGSTNKNPNGLTAEFESPLFSQEAEDFYTKLSNGDTKKYAEKLQAFKDFKTALFKINNEMPWYWQSLEGVDRLLQFDPMKPYWGGDEAKLKISCLESINLAITGLMNLYRKAVFDEEKWCYVLPANLRKFSMWVYVKDLRPIDTSWNEETEMPHNADIVGTGMQFLLTFCEFDIASGSKAVAELSNVEYTQAAQEISINYERMNRVDGIYLAGVINDNLETSKQNDINIPGVNQTTNKYPNDPFNLNKTVDSYKQKFSKEGINDQFKAAQNIAKDQLINLGNKKKEELLGKITSTVNDKIPSINNIIMNGVNRIDQASNVNGLLSPKAIEETIKANIYGLNPGQSIMDALNAAAAAGLGNVYK